MWTSFCRGFDLEKVETLVILSTKYYLIPQNCVQVRKDIIDKWMCAKECESEEDEGYMWCDRKYKIIGLYNKFSVIASGSNFAIVVYYPWSRVFNYKIRCVYCQAYVWDRKVVLPDWISKCNFCNHALASIK